MFSITLIALTLQFLRDRRLTGLCLLSHLRERPSLDEMDGRSDFVRSPSLLTKTGNLIVSRLLETIHTGFFLRQMYFYTVRAIANPTNLGTVDW